MRCGTQLLENSQLSGGNSNSASCHVDYFPLTVHHNVFHSLLTVRDTSSACSQTRLTVREVSYLLV